MRHVACVALALAALAAGGVRAARADPEAPPFRLAAAAGAPGWLDVSIAHRARYAHLENQFRAGAEPRAADARALSLRTLVAVTASSSSWFARVEVQDARAMLVDDGAGGTSVLDTGIVNAVEVLEAVAGARVGDALVAGDRVDVRAGRLTLDLGSRRFVARNRFRNTINGFTGAEVAWRSPRGHVARAFAVVPVARRPSAENGLADAVIEVDRDDTEAVLWTAFYGAPPMGPGLVSEAYVLGLHEGNEASSGRARRLLTLVARVHRPAASGRVDGELEGAAQVGRVGEPGVAHRAFFAHAEAGYTADGPWQPRLAVQYDHASGDRDPKDGTSGRFDTLFGARRFDFGPTGLYGPFARSNLRTVGLRASGRPAATLDALAAYRAFWLASAADAWTTAGLVDPTGNSGTFLGHQLEGRVRWDAVPGNLRLEVGAAALVRGRFAREAPGGRDANAAYGYLQLTLRL